MDTIAEPFLAPAPTPHTKPLGMLGFVLTASRNPIEIWGSRAFKAVSYTHLTLPTTPYV